MTTCGRGLRRAVGASPRPTWRRALLDTRGRLKPEYDAVVVGAGKVGWAGVEGPEGSLPRILGWWGGRAHPRPCPLTALAQAGRDLG